MGFRAKAAWSRLIRKVREADPLAWPKCTLPRAKRRGIEFPIVPCGDGPCYWGAIDFCIASVSGCVALRERRFAIQSAGTAKLRFWPVRCWKVMIPTRRP